MSERRTDSMERHITTILTLLIAAGVTWIASSVIDLKTTVASLGDKFALRTELDSLRVEIQRISAEQSRRTSLIDRLTRERDLR